VPEYDGGEGSTTQGNKRYELTDHLGNVRATITDRKLPIDTNQDYQMNYFLPDVVTSTGYYPEPSGWIWIWL
jgi:hypothetical protein